MRISFVGKGGSGKSTLSASLITYLYNKTHNPLLIFDADLNIHIPELLGFNQMPFENHLSHPKSSKEIKKWLIGNNPLKNIGEFRKTTPPTKKSNIIKINNLEASPLTQYRYIDNNLSIFTIGTYQNDEIGASCYHNNLAVFENILNHLDDKEGYVVADMLAGVDSFASTLHAQFDLTCFVAEPTKRCVEVYNAYEKLAKEADMYDKLYVVGNKIRNDQDKNFIDKNISSNKIIGYFYDDDYIRTIDQTGDKIDVSKYSDNNKKLLSKVYNKFISLPDTRNTRLKKIHQLHKKYVAQDFIKERFGDLSGQIDPEFKFE